MFKTMKLGKKLLLAFLLVGLIPALLVGIAAVWEASTALSTQAFNQLEGARAIKKAQVEGFFHEREGDMGVLVDMVDNVQEAAFSKLEAIQQLKKKNLKDLFNQIQGAVHIAKDDPYIGEAFNEINESTYHEGYAVWKVEMMERSCACSGIKKLFVIEGYVSPFTGELTNITTDQVLESQYDKQICASIDCHRR